MCKVFGGVWNSLRSLGLWTQLPVQFSSHKTKLSQRRSIKQISIYSLESFVLLLLTCSPLMSHCSVWPRSLETQSHVWISCCPLINPAAARQAEFTHHRQKHPGRYGPPRWLTAECSSVLMVVRSARACHPVASTLSSFISCFMLKLLEWWYLVLSATFTFSPADQRCEF